MDNPSNADLKRSFDGHAREDGIFQEAQRETNATVEKSLAAIHERLGHLPTRDEEAQIISEVLGQMFVRNGKLAFHGIVSLSVLVGAVIIIFGGLKTALAWLGFSYINK